MTSTRDNCFPQATNPHVITSQTEVVQLKKTFVIVGGRNVSAQETLDTLYKYNPDNDSWRLLPTRMTVRRDGVAAFAVSMNFRNCM